MHSETQATMLTEIRTRLHAIKAEIERTGGHPRRPSMDDCRENWWDLIPDHYVLHEEEWDDEAMMGTLLLENPKARKKHYWIWSVAAGGGWPLFRHSFRTEAGARERFESWTEMV